MRRLIVAGGRPLRGLARVPGDKSISHRSAILGAMAVGETTVTGFLLAEDCLRTLRAVEALGSKVDRDGTTVRITGGGRDSWQQPADVLDMGNSGTGMRLLLGALAGRAFVATLDGDASLRRRPMDRIAVPLGRMGAEITGQGPRCLPPVTIRGGQLVGIEYEMPVASAQVKSAVLLAGVQACGRTAVIEPGPSRDHTERMLEAFGVQVERGPLRASVTGPVELKGTQITVPGDLSSAAFLLAAAAMVPGSEVTVSDVGLNPTRTGFLDILAAMGAELTLHDQTTRSGEPVGSVTVRSAPLQGAAVERDLVVRAIDELPLVAVIATQAEGETRVVGAAELRVKESDRIAAMAGGLKAMGADITELEDGWLVRGPTPLRGARLAADMDHRVAMALAVAGLVADGETVIEGAEAVQTSFPDFAYKLSSLGARVKTV